MIEHEISVHFRQKRRSVGDAIDWSVAEKEAKDAKYKSNYYYM